MKVRVNYKSDLPPVSVKFSINGNEVDVPNNDFAIRFFIDGAPGTSFICTRKGNVYTNCAKTAADTLTCYIDNHKFGCGRLCCEFVDMTPNQSYSDKVQKTVTPAVLDVVLVDGAGDDNVEVLNATFNFEPNEIVSIYTEESQLDGGTNIVTITQSNGETSVFGVKNGKKGEKGDPGKNGVYINLDTGEAEVPDFNIIDDLVTGGSTDALSAEQGKILGEIVSPLVDVYSYDSSDLEDGWWGLDLDIGDTVGTKNNNPSDHKYKCTRLLVSAGDVIEVDTQGRWQARPWAITDRDRKLLSVSERTANPVQARLSIEQDGYFYVNCVADPETAEDPLNYLASFSLAHTVNNAPLVKKIPKMDKRVTSMYDVDEYDSNDLVDKWVWRNALSAIYTRKYREHANNHACMHLDVKCGDTVTVRTRAYTMRHSSQPEEKTAYEVVGWAVTDTEKNILSAANPTDSVTTTTLHIEQDGAVYMNCANDSASLSIFTVAHTYGMTNRQVEKLEALTEVLKGDTDHLIAMYYGRSNREKWTPSTLKDVLTHTHTIGNRKGCTDWFFSSLAYIEFVTGERHKLCPNSAPGGDQDKPSTKEDWVWLMDRFFSNTKVEVRDKNEHEGLRGLDDAIEELKETMGTPPRRHKVVLTLPIPYYYPADSSKNHWGTLSRSDIPDFNDEWMDIFDIHQTLNFDTGQTAAANYRTLANNDHREIVMKWYIDKAIARFNAENYENIDLAGFYWVDETLEYPLNSGNRDAIVGDIAEYIHSKGLKVYWIPYVTGLGRFDGDETHIDETYLQTGYFWKDGKLKDDGINYRDLMMKGTMEYLYKEAVTQGCGLEFEMSSFLFPDFNSSLRFSSMTQAQLDGIGASLTNIDSDFMDRLETLTGVFEDEHYFWRRHIAYYLDNNMVLAMSMSPNERVRRFMDRLSEIIRTT